MLYMLLLRVDPAVPSPEDGIQRHRAVTDEAIARGVYIACEALGPVEKTVRNTTRSIHDGPFAETREAVGGYYILDCKDADEAAEWAARIPVHAVEILPVMEVPGWKYDVAADRARRPM
jgi:hypothetical protein